eukprot:CAMPEP_0115533576 /NCGR_PEP_ID=MMETSP0271-20121206/86202_1 /TAXON_ID=71861 /ORGANISM="Scrippsiella trochoidea, Strain CCMP3099" /LENGTH=197 /DNA_ID=CAMNT_0002965981 /DNA_START=99 /DNA_END=692 /DNA_ORIENTATION=+
MTFFYSDELRTSNLFESRAAIMLPQSPMVSKCVATLQPCSANSGIHIIQTHRKPPMGGLWHRQQLAAAAAPAAAAAAATDAAGDHLSDQAVRTSIISGGRLSSSDRADTSVSHPQEAIGITTNVAAPIIDAVEWVLFIVQAPHLIEHVLQVLHFRLATHWYPVISNLNPWDVLDAKPGSFDPKEAVCVIAKLDALIV